MSAPQIPNLLSSRGGPRSRGARGRGRGRGSGDRPGDATPAQQRKDLDIQATDTDAAVSRLSAVSLGYLDDPFAPLFVSGAGTRRLPIINRGTYTRTTALDILINAFLSHHETEPNAPPQKKQIISLGAGTDTRFFRLRAKNKQQDLIYHEFDFPSVSSTKCRTVSNNEVLLKGEGNATLFVEPSMGSSGPEHESPEWGIKETRGGQLETIYCFHPNDLRKPMKPFESFHGIQSNIPTLLISECCLCYMEVDNARDILKWFADRIPSLGVILYEPIGVDDSFGQMMVANLAARNITMPTVKLYKTLQDQKDRLSELGFIGPDGGQEAETVERIWVQWVSPAEKERVDALEGLDEVEEWQMLARHYAITWGWKGASGWESWKALLQQNE
ncbi:Leucine carboxyl methyltransferase [Lachnellula suecica]|uniref:Leucine carboxyl methyltransferase 1 n=1 Tax=Lachnellula suecica TaxID=602035 RepID=A0A8T9BUP6_9HELO|nr:Leucine carboxyl methyltransferase [Lachnellula suecica]